MSPSKQANRKVQHFPGECEDCNSDPRTHVNNQDCTPNAGETETIDP